MPPEDNLTEDEPNDEFHRDLTDLVASAFARGAAVEQTWTITLPVADVPDWRVSIQKACADGGSESDAAGPDE